MLRHIRLSRTDLAGILVFLVLWGGSTAYLGATGADWTFPIVALAIFGIGLSGIGWLTTRGISTTRVEVRFPGRESALLLVYLLIYAVVFLGWGMGALREAVPAGRGQEIAVLVAKLVVHVVLPATYLWLALEAGFVEEFLFRAPGACCW